MKRPWSYEDDKDLDRDKSRRRFYLKVDDRRRRSVREGSDMTGHSSGSGSGLCSGLAYDRRKGGVDRREDSTYRSEKRFSFSSGLRRDFFPKGFRSERGRQRRDERHLYSWHRLRGDELNSVNKKHGKEEDGKDKRPVAEEKKEEIAKESFRIAASSESEMEEGELEPEPEIVEESRVEVEKRTVENEKKEDCCEEKENPSKSILEKEDKSETCDIETGDSHPHLKKNGRGEDESIEDEVIGEKIAMEAVDESVVHEDGNEEKERENMEVKIETQTEQREEGVKESGDKDVNEKSSHSPESDIDKSFNGEAQPETEIKIETEKNKPSYKDKGKGLALEDPVEKNRDDSLEGFDNVMEASSASIARRGFDLLLFRSESSSRAGLKPKAEFSSIGTGTKDDDNEMNNFNLDLSLSLPGISSHFQFVQNHNSSENQENSVKSRPVFQPLPKPVLVPLPVPDEDQIEDDTTKLLQNINPKSYKKPVNKLDSNSSFSARTGTRTNTRSKEKSRTSVIEKVVLKIVHDQLHLSTRMLLEMKGSSVSYLKQSICEMVSNSDKKSQLNSLQHSLRRRSDLTMDNLSKCPRPLIEILTVLKMGRPDFIKQGDNNISTPELVEIFCERKCSNLLCRSNVPVENCDCKICKWNPGFCSECMCMVCSTFDSASNTCTWVGCDVCMHWCHTDCALNNSFIKPGKGIQGNGIQFLCGACGHASQMFGFVQEVFNTCAKIWKVEVFVRELRFVKMIFEFSEDFRGIRLKDLVDSVLEILENDTSNHLRVVNYLLRFFSDAESNSNKGSTSNVQPTKDTSRNSWVQSLPLNKFSNSNIQEQKPVIDDLDRLIKLKKAESRMYQEKSDEARKEAEGYKQIILAKNKIIDEEYFVKVDRIKLGEFEERRKRRFEEFRVLEKEYKRFFGVKVGMEIQVRDLMAKLEGAKRKFR